MRTIIQNGRLVSPEGVQKADILIEDGLITGISGISGVSDADTVRGTDPEALRIDASGCFVFPGFIDTHTHFDLDLGVTVTADDFPSGTRAALLGGTTTVLDFATQDRGGSMAAAFALWQKKALGSHCNYGFHMALTEWNEQLHHEMAEMSARGVTSYKMYMVYEALRADDGAIYRALLRAGELQALLGVHCENWDLLNTLAAAQKAAGNFGPAAHPLSRPAPVEAEAVGRYLRIAELARAPAYVVHLSTEQGLFEVRRARARGQLVYLETCPQYLTLSDECYGSPGGAKYVMSPPLRKKEDNRALWLGLAQNEIQTLGTDHCSFTMAQKALGANDFTKIPNGCAGVQNRAALYYTCGVEQGLVTLPQMAAQLSANAAKLFGMYPQKGALAPGADADIVLWDPAYRETVSFRTLAHRCDNSPYEGMPTKGRARDVFLNGVWAVRNGALVEPAAGRYVPRGKTQLL